MPWSPGGPPSCPSQPWKQHRKLLVTWETIDWSSCTNIQAKLHACAGMMIQKGSACTKQSCMRLLYSSLLIHVEQSTHLILRINHQWPAASTSHQNSILCGHLQKLVQQTMKPWEMGHIFAISDKNNRHHNGAHCRDHQNCQGESDTKTICLSQMHTNFLTWIESQDLSSSYIVSREAILVPLPNLICIGQNLDQWQVPRYWNAKLTAASNPVCNQLLGQETERPRFIFCFPAHHPACKVCHL